MFADEYFRIIGNNGSTITLVEAEKLTGQPVYYDPLGVGTLASPYYAETMLLALKLYGFIQDFQVLALFPSLPPEEVGVVY